MLLLICLPSIEKTVVEFTIQPILVQCRAGQYGPQVISQYFLAEWRYSIYIDIFSVARKFHTSITNGRTPTTHTTISGRPGQREKMYSHFSAK